jgi:hypothetical protein
LRVWKGIAIVSSVTSLGLGTVLLIIYKMNK